MTYYMIEGLGMSANGIDHKSSERNRSINIRGGNGGMIHASGWQLTGRTDELYFQMLLSERILNDSFQSMIEYECFRYYYLEMCIFIECYKNDIKHELKYAEWLYQNQKLSL